MSINPGTQNIEKLGNCAETLRLIFRALDLKMFAHDSIAKTMLFQPRPRFNQSHLPAHHANSSMFSAIPHAPTQTHNSAARTLPSSSHPLPLRRRCQLPRPLRSICLPTAAARELHGTVVEQCSRENPGFPDCRAQTLFHRFRNFIFVRPVLHSLPTAHSPFRIH